MNKRTIKEEIYIKTMSNVLTNLINNLITVIIITSVGWFGLNYFKNEILKETAVKIKKEKEELINSFTEKEKAMKKLLITLASKKKEKIVILYKDKKEKIKLKFHKKEKKEKKEEKKKNKIDKLKVLFKEQYLK